VRAARLAVGAVDLHHGNPDRAQIAGQRSTVGTGALHADRGEVAVSAEPISQGTVARRGGGELPITERPADLVDHLSVVGLAVGVDPADHDAGCRTCHAGHALPPPLDRSGEARAVGSVDKTVMGLVRRLL
jgi:hypothetical protein